MVILNLFKEAGSSPELVRSKWSREFRAERIDAFPNIRRVLMKGLPRSFAEAIRISKSQPFALTIKTERLVSAAFNRDFFGNHGHR
jgi:hypothetical protein